VKQKLVYQLIHSFICYLIIAGRYKTPPYTDYEDLERKFWKNITFIAPLYGADLCGSLTDPSVDVWNIGRLGSILDFVNQVILVFSLV
jgi:hypothetical protein